MTSTSARYHGTMLVLLIGPSGVGKTTLGKCAAGERSYVRFIDLDDLVRPRCVGSDITTGNKYSERFADLSVDELERLGQENSGDTSLCLVAVGAGSIHTEPARRYIETLPCRVTIYAEPEEVHHRNPHLKHRSLDRFKQDEYSAERVRFYNTSQDRVDVSDLNVMEARNEFMRWLVHFWRRDRKDDSPSGWVGDC